METYIIRDIRTGEALGTIDAIDADDAEYIAAGTFFDHDTTDMIATKGDCIYVLQP